jgi:hypothetical protein
LAAASEAATAQHQETDNKNDFEQAQHRTSSPTAQLPYGGLLSAADIVQRQVEAYNNRDLDAFVAAYSDGVEIFRMPAAEPALSGKKQLAEFYASQRFNIIGLKAEILNRIVSGNKVVDHERVHGLRSDPVELIAVYDVVDGFIRRVWFFPSE